MAGLAHAKGVQLGDRPEEDDGQGFGFVGRQAREAGPVVEAQLDAALVALVDDDRQAGFRQGVDVAQDRAPGHLKFGGQLRAGLPSPVLEQQEDPEQSRRPHGDLSKTTGDVILPGLGVLGEGF